MAPTEQDRDSRIAMITLAERLFAEEGIEAVSMRRIAVGAGQRNNSAVAYHFGDRAGLVRAVLDHRSGPIDARRLQLIDDLGPRPGLDDVLRVFVQPLAETIRPGSSGWYLRFLADATADSARTELGHGSEPEGVLWVNRHLARLVSSERTPHRGLGPTSPRRLRWMVVITLRVLADHERLSAEQTGPSETSEMSGADADIDTVVADLVATLAALFSAP